VKVQKQYCHQKATAKISAGWFLINHQKKSLSYCWNYFKSIAPPSVTIKAFEHHGGEPYMTPIDSKGYQAAAKAVKKTFGKKAHPGSWWWQYSYLFYFRKRIRRKNYFYGFWFG
jgi:hypothetical protein